MTNSQYRILVFEWLTGGGCFSDGLYPANCKDLVRQGQQMLKAVTEDFLAAGFTVTSMLDRRIELELKGAVSIVDAGHCIGDLWAKLADQHDWTLIIAPESGGCLSECLQWAASRSAISLNPGPELTKLATNKNRMQSYLQSRGVPVPDCISGDEWLNHSQSFSPHDWVVKPADGCSGEGVKLFPVPKDQDSLRKYLKPEFRIEEFVPGVSVSVNVLRSRNGSNKFQRPNRQHFKSQPLGLFSHCTNDLPGELVRRAIALAEMTIDVLPDFSGMISLDMVLGAKDVVIEVNPRVTTSYGLGQSPAKWLRDNF